MSDTKLLPCPFCGADYAIIGKYGLGQADVECMMCHTKTNRFATESEAIAAWNTRHRPTSEALSLEELEGMDGCPVWLVCHHWQGWALSFYSPMDEEFYFTRQGEPIHRNKEDYNKDTKWRWAAFATKPGEV